MLAVSHECGLNPILGSLFAMKVMARLLRRVGKLARAVRDMGAANCPWTP